MLSSVANKIEKNLRDFLWEGYGENKSDHLINWNTVTKSKNKVGLGIGNLVKKNEALLGSGFGDSLWNKILFGAP